MSSILNILPPLGLSIWALTIFLFQTRMQILHPSTGGLYTGLTNAVSTIYRVEGWRTLWKGVSSVIVGAGAFGRLDWGSRIIKTDFVLNRSGPRCLLRYLRDCQGDGRW